MWPFHKHDWQFVYHEGEPWPTLVFRCKNSVDHIGRIQLQSSLEGAFLTGLLDGVIGPDLVSRVNGSSTPSKVELLRLKPNGSYGSD